MTKKKPTIEFLEDTHTYLADGIIIPSVSELIRFKFPEAYKGVPERILKKKASYGTKVHQMIEDFIEEKITLEEIKAKRIDPDIKIAVEQFDALRKKWMFYVKDMEQIVSYRGRYAGMYDIRTITDELIDIKTTSTLHENWLSWQLGLYYTALEIKKPYGYVLWIPKGKMAQIKQIDVVSTQECVQLIEEYEKHSSEE